jgi:hypothetical protein
MIIRENTKIESWTCKLKQKDGEALVRAVEKVVEKEIAPPEYNVLGADSVFALSSAISSSNAIGHNCLTWAYEALRSVGDKTLKANLPTDFTKFVASVPGSVIRSNSHPPKMNYATLVITLCTAFMAFLIYNYLRKKDNVA